ncbi:Multidrug resistance efflux transporter EmrE [Glarea lozoyensis ATCC 20868]|uniref:Multidrug resistance efflux transporter EmrE n=1 Tax=Glarea lozoyensis (strain ATCC 20868 / MF5171) TaxID=1116229 RepID=S3DIR1_GLAL2|nr:Multidrug resistance efflux transporter EmrE [Glarea lozoyensis ATCC 20868]EPE37049.1 Multidrug resistance efflux transporter EmrE [Glarea lozoyensis ATCC 20868]
MLSPSIPAQNDSSSIKPEITASIHEDNRLDSFQNVPSHFDAATNVDLNQTYLPPKSSNTALLNPDSFRRLSISTISSYPSRNPSPYPPPPTTFKGKASAFWNRNYGLFLVALSQLFGALMNVTTRLLELEDGGMHPLQILFARMGLTMVFCCAWMWWKKVPNFLLGERGIRWLLLARGFSGFFGIYGMYYSLQYLPIADAVVITFLAPSVASYGCSIFLREPFPRTAQYASLISLLGVILIARPTSFFTSPEATPSPPPQTNGTSTYHEDFPTPTNSQRLAALAVALLGVLGAAGAFTTIRLIGHRAHPLISVNYFAFFCTTISLTCLTLPIPYSPSFALPNGFRQWCMLLFLGICGFVMQFMLTKGLAVGGRGEGGRATNMIYCNMLFALALDKVVFGVSPGWWSLGGSGLILGSAVWVAVGRNNGGKESGRERVMGEEEMGLMMEVHGRDAQRGRSFEESRIPR